MSSNRIRLVNFIHRLETNNKQGDRYLFGRLYKIVFCAIILSFTCVQRVMWMFKDEMSNACHVFSQMQQSTEDAHVWIRFSNSVNGLFVVCFQSREYLKFSCLFPSSVVWNLVNRDHLAESTLKQDLKQNKIKERGAHFLEHSFFISL